MPLSLAERVRERRNQRLADSQRRRALAEEAHNHPATVDNNNNNNNPLVPVLDIDTSNHSIPPFTTSTSLTNTTTSTFREWGNNNNNNNNSRPMSPDAFTPRRGGGSNRALVSPLNLPFVSGGNRPPASPTQRQMIVSSAPSSPGGSNNNNNNNSMRYPPSSPRGSGGGGARNLYNSNFSSSQQRSQQQQQQQVTPIPYLTSSSSSPSWEENEGLIPILPLRSDRSVSSELIVPRYHSTNHNSSNSTLSVQGLHQQHATTSSYGRGGGGGADARSVYSESNIIMDDEQPRRSSSSSRRHHHHHHHRQHHRRHHSHEVVPMDERSTGSRRSIDYDDDAALRPSSTTRRSSNNKPPSSVRLLDNGNNNNNNKLLPPSATLESSIALVVPRTPRGTVLQASSSMAEDDVSSLGGVEDQLSQASRTSVQRLTIALRANTPKGLMGDERALWEAFQQSMTASRKAAMDEADPKMREKLKQQQDEQDKSFRAIQRVLADVSEDRDRANSQLKESKQEQRKLQRTVEKLEEQVEELRDNQRQAKKESQSLSLSSAVVEADGGVPGGQLDEISKKVQNLEDDKEKLAAELDSRNKQISRLKRHLQGKGDVIIEDSEGLKKELEERSAALENAKMIIASLENASGSLASDTRFKIKAKDAEILSLKTDARHQQKKLDNLATQLKEVQREKAQIAEERAHDMAKKSIWKASLREHLSDMQSASVILEATRDDPSAMERFSQVVAEALETMQRTVDALDQGLDEEDEDSRHPPSPGSRYDGSHHGNDMDSLASGRSAASSSRMSKDTMREVKQELEEKSVAVRRLEEELRKVKEEAQNSRLDAERIEQQRDSDTKTLYGEIQMLRIQCNTNMELLAKKERELAVLRDSLKVEDDDVGYISDDATDIDDEEEEEAARASNTNLSMTKYSASQTEALAALLAHGRGGTVDAPLPTGGQATDADQLKLELSQARMEAERSQKELKIEKESLANAKMIISSLEKANKSMMEDLRSRLQESNSAIHSLLEKSMESEKTTRKLETELEALRRENEELLHNGNKGNILVGEEKKEEFTETAE